MQHIIVFAYIFTILIGVSALTIQWLAGKSESEDHSVVMKSFISMLLVMNVYDFVIYYFDNIMNRPSNNLMLSFGDCLIAILVILWLKVESNLGQVAPDNRLVSLGQKFVIGYLIIWLIAVCFCMEYSWIRLIIDIPLICLLVIGSAFLIIKGMQNGEEQKMLIYKGILTFFITGNYLIYLISESGLLLSTGKNIMDITIFFWLVINAANMMLMYKKDFAESYLQQTEPVAQTLNLEEAMDLVKEKYELTKREIEILREVYDGKTNTQIAEDLFISESTVKAHIYNIFRKMNVKSRVEAVCIIREEKESK